MRAVTVAAPALGMKEPHHLPRLLTGASVPATWPGQAEPVPVDVTECVFTDDDTRGPVVHLTVDLPDDAAVPTSTTGDLAVVVITTAQQAGPVAFYCDELTIYPAPREVPA